jgi:hypothetical protein
MQQNLTVTICIEGRHYFDVTNSPSGILDKYRDPHSRRTFVEQDARVFAPFAEWVEFEYRILGRKGVSIPFGQAVKRAITHSVQRLCRANLLAKIGLASIALLWVSVLFLVLTVNPDDMETTSEIMEALGTFVVMTGTIWIGAGVALSAKESLQLVRVRDARLPVTPETFDIAEALLTASRRCMEGTYIVAVGTIFVLLHVLCHHLQMHHMTSEKSAMPTTAVAANNHSDHVAVLSPAPKSKE